MTDEQRLTGKGARRQRIGLNHAMLRAKYMDFVFRHGRALTYEQWLHPQMRRPFELKEIRRG